MERIAFIILILISYPVLGSENRAQRELDFILGKQEKAPVVPKVVTYETWKNGEQKLDADGMIVDSTSTALAAPIRTNKDRKKIYINLNDENNGQKTFKSPRKRSR